METDDRYMVPGLVRGLVALQAFSQEKKDLSVSELAEIMGVNRSSAFRIAYTLEHCGFLHKASDSRRYALNSKVLDLGFTYLSGLDLLEPSRPILQRLRDQTTIACHLVIRQGTDIVFVDRVQATGPFTSTVGVGTRWPAHATVTGQQLLADLSDDEIRELYRDHQWATFTEGTPTGIEALLARIHEIRGQPALVSWGYFNPAMAACAAPIYRLSDNSMIASVSVSCPLGGIPQAEFEGRIRDAVIAAAHELSRTLSLNNAQP
ncbi:IclR family transcriptional regulator [Zobellella endophytica]|uniref:IclR family transcriptional regulator n=1 Tax=Zobellella endophytica TaxID=2116700 RepID=A0A2P7R861_9GAMM|nr:IclR family transcriptional regulator [Zobellella endophytica]PSJ46373.1 IclR family transcriptional regulator [Zobellella endophytica]